MKGQLYWGKAFRKVFKQKGLAVLRLTFETPYCWHCKHKNKINGKRSFKPKI